MAPDAPERESEMQDTPPCRCPEAEMPFGCLRFSVFSTVGGCMKTWLDRARGQATDIRKISMNFVSC